MYLQFAHIYLTKIKKFKTNKILEKDMFIIKLECEDYVHKIIFVLPGYTKNVYHA